MADSLRGNSNCRYLDLKDNCLDNTVAESLVDMLHKNFFIEDLVLTGNHQINHNLKVAIEEECRKNLLIKEYIIPSL